MSKFSYQAMMHSATGCHGRQAVVFSADEELIWDEIEQEAISEMTSQTCPSCGKAHPRSVYVLSDAKCRRPDHYNYSNVYPKYEEESDQYEMFA